MQTSLAFGQAAAPPQVAPGLDGAPRDGHRLSCARLPRSLQERLGAGEAGLGKCTGLLLPLSCSGTFSVASPRPRWCSSAAADAGPREVFLSPLRHLAQQRGGVPRPPGSAEREALGCSELAGDNGQLWPPRAPSCWSRPQLSHLKTCGSEGTDCLFRTQGRAWWTQLWLQAAGEGAAAELSQGSPGSSSSGRCPSNGMPLASPIVPVRVAAVG